MKYRYLAATPKGELKEGEIEAFSPQEAAEKLREKALVPIEIKELRLSFWKRLRLRRHSSEELLLFTEQLHRLLKAGLPLDKAFQLLAKIFATAGKEELERMALNVQQELAQGRRLSEALAQERMFPTFYVSLIEAGEVSGALEEILADLARYLKEQETFRQELLSALLYPSFLLIFGLLAVQTVLVYVLPRFALIFEEMGVKPPWFTNLLIHLGLFWKQWGWVFLLLLLLAFFYLRFRLTTPEYRPRLEKRLLALPFLGRVLLLADLARIFRGLAVMMRGGVPIETALRMAANVGYLTILRDFFTRLGEEIRHGHRLSSLILHLPVRVDFILDLIAIGEETGNLASSFRDIAELCEEEVRVSTKRFLTLLEPATILFFGLLLGTIIVSILVAIFDLRLS